MKHVVIAIVILVAVGGVAEAKDPKKAAAELAFKEGQRLQKAGNLAEACAKFEESQKLDPATGTLLNLARCYELDGRIASAWETFLEAEALAKDKKDKKRQKAAHDRAVELEPRVPRLIIAASGAPDGTVILLRGEPFAADLLGVALPVDPGPQAVDATADGYQAFTQTVEAVEGQTVTVTIVMEKVPVVTKGDGVGDGTGVGDGIGDGTGDGGDDRGGGGGGGGGHPVLGATIGGAGAIALGSAIFLGLSAKSDYDAAFDDGLCDPDSLVCSEAGQTATDDARGKANLATIVGGVGLVAIGVGVYFLVSGGGDDGEAQASYIVPTVSGDAVGVAFGGSL
jgi:hypothetical protein